MNNNLKILSARFKGLMPTLPYKAGVIMVAFTKDRFRQQNWLDTYPEAWKPRKAGGWGKKNNNQGRALLMQTGRLRRSIRIVNTTNYSVTIGSDTPYASAHNDGMSLGLIQQVAAHKRRRFSTETTKRGRTKKTQTGIIDVSAHVRRIDQRIPRRRFMGPSRYLSMQISRMIGAEINKIFRS